MFKNKFLNWAGVLLAVLLLIALMPIPAFRRWWLSDERPIE